MQKQQMVLMSAGLSVNVQLNFTTLCLPAKSRSSRNMANAAWSQLIDLSAGRCTVATWLPKDETKIETKIQMRMKNAVFSLLHE